MLSLYRILCLNKKHIKGNKSSFEQTVGLSLVLYVREFISVLRNASNNNCGL